MQRPVLIGSISAGADSTQWAVRLGEDTWTEAHRKEGQAGGCTVNGGVPGGWWGWGAKASGPLYRGEVARSGAALPPGASMLGHTTKTDKEVEQFNAKYIKQNPVYRPDCCEDYACSLIGWLLGAGYLLETLLHFTNSAGAPEDSLQHEFEIHEEVIESTDSDESEEEEKIEEEDGNYEVAKETDGHLESLQSLIVAADDPTYKPPYERFNDNEYLADEGSNLLFDEEKSNDDTQSFKRKKAWSELEDEEDLKVVSKKRKPGVDKQEEEGHSEKEEAEKDVYDDEGGDVKDCDEDVSEEDEDVNEEGEDVNEEEEDEDVYEKDEDENVYEELEEEEDINYNFVPTEEASTSMDSWSSEEEENSDSEDDDDTHNTNKKEKQVGDVNAEDEDVNEEEEDEDLYEKDDDKDVYEEEKEEEDINYDFVPTEEASPSMESWSSKEEENSDSEDDDDTQNTNKKEKHIYDVDESGYSTHEQSMELLNTPAA